MTTKRIDGTRAAQSLMERISSEDGVGEKLASRTKEEYARKMYVMESRIKQRSGECTPATLATHLSHLVSTGAVAQSTARAMKAAAMFWLAEQAQNALTEGRQISEYEDAYQKIRQLPTTALPGRTDRTSSPKLKFMPKATLESITAYAENSPQSKYAGALVAFLKANILVGLRPEEWFSAEFFNYLHRNKEGEFMRFDNGRIKSSISMVVENAKTTHGRGNGDKRELLLHAISDDDLATLLHFREIAESFASKFPLNTPRGVIAKAFFKPLQQTMSAALKKIGYKGQQPTTYSTRHQAVANAKSSGLNEREIAAMFGHSSTATAKSHYGKKVNGWMKMTFRPSPESIAAVPVKLATRDIANPAQRTIATATEWNRNNTKY